MKVEVKHVEMVIVAVMLMINFILQADCLKCFKGSWKGNIYTKEHCVKEEEVCVTYMLDTKENKTYIGCWSKHWCETAKLSCKPCETDLCNLPPSCTDCPDNQETCDCNKSVTIKIADCCRQCANESKNPVQCCKNCVKKINNVGCYTC